VFIEDKEYSCWQFEHLREVAKVKGFDKVSIDQKYSEAIINTILYGYNP